MSSDVTIVVPTRNSASTLHACLESIRSQTYPCTLVVVDNFSTDASVLIAKQFVNILKVIGPERSAQRNAGASATNTSIIGFVDSDMVLSPTVVAEVVAAIGSGAASVVVPEETVGEGFWADVSAYERSFYEGSESIEAPRFFPRRVFEDTGGFDEAMTGAEDWDLGLRTAGAGRRVRINAKITHNEGHVRYFNICRKKGYYAAGVALYIKKHGIQGVVAASRRPWLRHPSALAKPLGLGLLALKIGQAFSMVLAMGWASLGHRIGLPDRLSASIRRRGNAH
jgi:glycosyltransferase involved in cell wall biosynthesis